MIDLIVSKKELLEQIMSLQVSMLDLNIEQINKEATDLSGVKLIYKLVNNLDNKILRLSAEQIASKLDNLVIIYINNTGKLSITVAVSKKIIDKINAGTIAKSISLFLDGTGGGGQPTIAQAGGVDTSKLPELKDMIIDSLQKL